MKKKRRGPTSSSLSPGKMRDIEYDAIRRALFAIHEIELPTAKKRSRRKRKVFAAGSDMSPEQAIRSVRKYLILSDVDRKIIAICAIHLGATASTISELIGVPRDQIIKWARDFYWSDD